MKRIWTTIGVENVAHSYKWYRKLLGLPESAPAHDYYGQIRDVDGTVLLCLHKWGEHDHPTLESPSYSTPGNGLLLFFCVDDFDEALQRAQTLASQFEKEPHINPNSQSKEFSLRDPDGYYVSISAFSSD